MRKVTILQHDGGELANQLWNYTSVYAYCLYRGYECENLSFFEYAQYFSATGRESLLFRFLSFPFRDHHDRRSSFRRRIWRNLYKVFIVIPTIALSGSRNLFSNDTRAPDLRYDLPPTVPSTKSLERLEKSGTSFFLSSVSGGFFRNPKGIIEYRDAIRKRFAPAPDVARAVEDFMHPLRSQYAKVVGVHLRQGDYRVFKEGKYWLEQRRVREILDAYAQQTSALPDSTCFVIASDGPIDAAQFTGLPVFISKHTVGVDLFILASCDAIIGSNSTFGYFVAYLANIPHIVMQNAPIDWPYYAGRKEFFENKYLSVMTY